MEQHTPQTEQELTQQAAVRRQKLADLRAAGQDPFTLTQYPPTRPTSRRSLPTCPPKPRPARPSRWPAA